MNLRLLRALGPTLLCFACSSESTSRETEGSGDAGPGAGGSGNGACPAGMVSEEGNCVDPLRRFEPEERVDFNNVVSYGGGVLTMDLPDPPKSGFRLVVPPREMGPGEEVESCHAWAYPTLQHRNVYAARVYTSGNLHHSNLYGIPFAASGPSPYPACAPGQGNIINQVQNWLAGDVSDVLFANSTQIERGEQIVFSRGMAFKVITDGREVATSIHWLNPSPETVTSEIVYDFFTMPDELVETEIFPFVFENRALLVPAKTQGDVTMACDITGAGNIVSIMPHTHRRAVSFDVALLRSDGTEESAFHDGAFDTDSEITVFEEPISLEGFSKIRHTCRVDNDLSRDIVWGTGDDEMCTLFGYIYPASAQQAGYTPARTDPAVQPDCLPLPVGQYRK